MQCTWRVGRARLCDLALLAVCLLALLPCAGSPAHPLQPAHLHAHSNPSLPMQAALCGKEDVLSLLIVFGADLEQQDSGGSTPLLLAAEKGRLACLRALLVAGAHPGATDGSGRTALYRAAESGKLEVLRVLLEGGAGVGGAAGPEGQSALHAAAAAGQPAVHALLKAGLEVDAKDACGRCAAALEKFLNAMLARHARWDACMLAPMAQPERCCTH